MFLSHQYDSFWIFLLVCISIPLLAFSITRFAAPPREGPEKSTSYESGIEPKGDTWIRFQIRYYMFALVFTVFDVETVFLYPWATSFEELGLFAFVEVIVFIFILIVGLVYAWRKGALEWC
uniref:NAD(P)H-quinone oxidoreductase subunit 3, chloroplastic n=1 Tax=Adiantum capillus-veneris TaxID=13818 RepID=NU3C_ADICA|nr:NADH dehydrogenase subunit 3 [Adiantum capillus-veneris]Q85FL5.2 RecName: Full=NAD(P)H-quinone oxidoreductase subunit 3, chloroplastic; AltName: Full=NAD(P)H dehydrogenase subunit 3; AltName: Full=NADH-plastoquinone oxidoreductase subunit 3 [Adiantum capillus-veneris]AAP29397.2 NADH dehydrogenase subunit 3 [Adiantum capillus-veneris]